MSLTVASTFYGKAFTPDRAELLTKACKYLDMAIRADSDTKRDMAFKAALKAEEETFKLA